MSFFSTEGLYPDPQAVAAPPMTQATGRLLRRKTTLTGSSFVPSCDASDERTNARAAAMCREDNKSLHAYVARPGHMLSGKLDFALLSRFGRLAKRAPVRGRGEQKRPVGVVNSYRGHFLALGRMLEAIKC